METVEVRIVQERDSFNNPCGWTFQYRTRSALFGALGAFIGFSEWGQWRPIPVVEA